MLEERWNEIETSNPQITPWFLSWFLHYKADMMKSTMLQPIHEEPGLSCPPQQFTTNPSEAINSVIKNQVGHKSHQFAKVEQYWEVDRAIIGWGNIDSKSSIPLHRFLRCSGFKATASLRSHKKSVDCKGNGAFKIWTTLDTWSKHLHFH